MYSCRFLVFEIPNSWALVHAQDMGAVRVRPVTAESVLLEPEGAAEACGVQVPAAGRARSK